MMACRWHGRSASKPARSRKLRPHVWAKLPRSSIDRITYGAATPGAHSGKPQFVARQAHSSLGVGPCVGRIESTIIMPGECLVRLTDRPCPELAREVVSHC